MQQNPKEKESLRPRRVYLEDQVSRVLRERIYEGGWGEYLPPERALSEKMQVGRNTLRQALAKLEQEGLIEKGHVGRRRRIIAKSASDKPVRSNRVVMLTPQDPHRLSSFFLREIDILRRLFNEIGMRLDPLTSKAFNVQNCGRILDRMTHMEAADLWILQMAPHPVQEWFSDSDLPALVVGYTYPSINLPFVTENIIAAAQHAVGLLSSKGHESIALLQQESVLAGHEQVSHALAEICRRKHMDLTVVRYRETTADLCLRIDGALKSRSRPTAVLTTKTSDTLTCITHLAQKALKVPEDMSVISLFDDPALDGVVPAVTRYAVNEEHFMHQVFNMAEKLMSGRRALYEPVQLVPELVRGCSVDRPCA